MNLDKFYIPLTVLTVIILAIVFFLYPWKQEEDIKSLDQIYSEGTNLKEVEYVNGIPKVVYIVWFGGKQNMSTNRLKALNSLTQNIGVPYILITENNFKDFEVSDHPIHPSFKNLSGNHQSDYLRAYLLHHHGGGYHDIKYRDLGWQGEWEDFKDEQVWMKSCAEIEESHIGYDLDHPETKEIQKQFSQLGSMCWIISRKNTPYTKDLLDKIDKKLDFHLNKLEIYPSTKPAGYYADRPMEKLREGDKYPLRWLELMGEHFHILMHKYREHNKLDLPRPNLKNYR